MCGTIQYRQIQKIMILYCKKKNVKIYLKKKSFVKMLWYFKTKIFLNLFNFSNFILLKIVVGTQLAMLK